MSEKSDEGDGACGKSPTLVSKYVGKVRHACRSQILSAWSFHLASSGLDVEILPWLFLQRRYFSLKYGQSSFLANEDVI
jgi:hypothetical protein